MSTICNPVTLTCQTNGCGPNDQNGQLDEDCSAQGVNDGTCIPLGLEYREPLAICVQNGTSKGACSSDPTRFDESQACVAGAACDHGTCYTLCSPFDTRCPANETCHILWDQPPIGYCIP